MAKNKVYIVKEGASPVNYIILWIIFALVSFGVKTVVLTALSTSPTGATTGNGFLTLYEVHNTGAAFNLFQNQPGLIIFASIIALAAMIVTVFGFTKKITPSVVSALALLSAGISMNLFERLTTGYVTDYIQCDFISGFPLFNTSDIMIVLGAFGLILAILTRGQHA